MNMARRGARINSARDSMIVSIDFGTTQSCFAFVRRQKPSDIYVHKWGESDSSLKTPTSVLLEKTHGGYMNFKTFGSHAENIYWEAEDKSNYELYRRFKMTLHTVENVDETVLVYSEKGKPELALTIIKYSLEYMKHIAFCSHIPREFQDDITWILTVPAIWTENSQLFMRRAAYEANLVDCVDSKKLKIGIEPEAAAFLCINMADMGIFGFKINELTASQVVLNLNQGQDRNRVDGDHFMVLDGGGGTMDIIAFKFNSKGRLVGLVEPSGGPWGGCSVDDEFIEWLKEHWGTNYIRELQEKCPDAWNAITLQFVKRKSSYNKGEKMKFSIDLEINSEIKAALGEGLDEKLQGGKLVLEADTVYNFFKPTLYNITSHLDKLLRRNSMRNIKYAFLVGGFGSSKLVWDHLARYFQDRRRGQTIECCFPTNECWTAVAKGAILFGLNETKVLSRVAARSIGRKLRVPFREDRGYNERHVYQDKRGREMVKNVFSTLVEKGESYETGAHITFETKPANASDRDLFVELFQSTRSDPVHIDERHVSRLCSVRVPLPSSGDKTVTTVVTFGAALKLEFKTSNGVIVADVRY